MNRYGILDVHVTKLSNQRCLIWCQTALTVANALYRFPVYISVNSERLPKQWKNSYENI